MRCGQLRKDGGEYHVENGGCFKRYSEIDEGLSHPAHTFVWEKERRRG